MQQAEIGSHVVYTRKENGVLTSHDAHIIGYEHLVEGEVLPGAHLAFLNAQQLAVLNGVDWHRAMEEVFSVPYGFSEGHHFYELDPAIKLAVELGAAQERIMSLDSDIAAAKSENEKLATQLTAERIPNP